MIYIFHGDEQTSSRNAFNSLIDTFQHADNLKIDSKNINIDQINNFLNGQSFFHEEKAISISNFFSTSKVILDKLVKILVNSSENNHIIIWQDKLLNATQLKIFPKAQVKIFKGSNIVFSCLNEIKPKNFKILIPKLHQVYKENMYDLFLYLAKNSIRKQLNSYTRFTPQILKKTYTNLIELDYQNKNGTLNTPKQIALERILINLIN